MIIFANELQDMKQNRETLAKWVELRLYRGFYTFTYQDVKSEFSLWNDSYINTAINRLVKLKTIVSPAKGFYVIIPVEYALSGLVPATFYIDQMMSYLNRHYYIGLSNAAGFYGAAHQRPQTFTVINDGASLRNGIRAGINYSFINRKKIFSDFITTRKTKLGSINVSSPELTAADLTECQGEVGGLNRVCTIMSELAESLNFSMIDTSYFSIYGSPVYQRLGYILDEVLEESELADTLYSKMKELNIPFRKTLFKTGKASAGCDVNEKWKIIINQEIDIDG